MPGPTVFASDRQFAGIANEVTPGTQVAMTATIPISPGTLVAEDKPLYLPDDALRGSMADEYDALVGPIYSDLAWSGPIFVDTLPYLIRNILGDYTGTGASAPFSHAFALLNSGTGQPLTQTLTDYDGVSTTSGARWYGSLALTDLAIKWNAESALFTYDAKALAFPSAIPGSTPTPTPSAIRAQPSWQMTVGVAGPATGGTQIKTVIEGQLNIKRQASVRWTGQNSQTPYIIARGKCGIDGTQRIIAADESPLTALLAGTIQQFQWLYTQGAGAATQAVQIDMANVSYRTVPRDRSKELVEYNTTFKAEANTTNAGTSGGRSPAKITVTNAVALTVY
jgi:hypothetical protein